MIVLRALSQDPIQSLDRWNYASVTGIHGMVSQGCVS